MYAPFSPILGLGLAAPRIADPFLEGFLNQAARRIWRRHQHEFDRLKGHTDLIYGIDPIDLPIAIVLRVEDRGPRLKVTRQSAFQPSMGIIRGPLLSLIALAEGEIDGDALFFSRDLEIEGNTEAVVALRNAIDDAGLNLIEELSLMFGPFSKPLFHFGGLGKHLYRRATGDLNAIQSALLAPVLPRQAVHEERLCELSDRLSRVETAHRKSKRKANALDSAS